MDLNQFVNNDFLKTEDIKEEKNNWVITGFGTKKFEEEEKPYIDIERKEERKNLILNVTNTKSLLNIFGNKSEELIGKIVVFRIGETEYGGKSYKVIRINEEETKKINQ